MDTYKHHSTYSLISFICSTFIFLLCFNVIVVHSQNHPSNEEILLFKYISDGNSFKVDSLLDLDTDPNAIYFKQITALAYAASKGHLKILNSLIKKGADLETIAQNSGKNATPLGFAVLNNNTQCINALVESGALISGTIKPDARALMGPTKPFTFNWLMHAIKMKNAESVKSLIAAGAPLNYTADLFMDSNYYGKSPLIQASEMGDKRIVKLLIDNGADIDAFGRNWQNESVNTALMAAAEFGHNDITELLISEGAIVTLTDEAGMTPFLSAAKRSQIQTSKTLLENGANINDKNGNNLNALQISLKLHRESARKLERNIQSWRLGRLIGNLEFALKRARGEWVASNILGELTNLDIEYIDHDLTRLYFGRIVEPSNKTVSDAIKEFRYKNLNFTKFSINNGIDINHKSGGISAIKMAQEFQLDGVLGVLLEAGASVSDIPLSSLLKHSIKNNNLQTFEDHLKNAGFVSDSLKCVLLESALITSNIQVVDILLNEGANINCRNTYGQSVLHTAAYLGKEQIIDFLISKGANKTQTDFRGVYPFMIGKFMDHVGILPKLRISNMQNTTQLNIGYSLAEIEKSYYNIYDPVLAERLNSFDSYLFSNALKKNISSEDVLIAWLNQDIKDTLKLKYASALFSQGLLEIQGERGAMEVFRSNHSYSSWDDFNFNLSGNYQTGSNKAVNFTSKGTNKFSKTQDMGSSTHDRSSSIAFHLQKFPSRYFGSTYQAGMGVYIGACGGWDQHCIFVVDGDCYHFSDRDPQTATFDYSIEGSYKIPKVTTFNGYNMAYPGVEIWNTQQSIPLKVVQNGNTTFLDPNERRSYNRGQGEVIIMPEWNGSISASGGDCTKEAKMSKFMAEFPSLSDASLRFEGTSFSNRVKNYSDIYLLKRTYQEGADTLSSTELYGLSSTILLKSELARDAYKGVVKAELWGIINFLENTNFTNLNNALMSLNQSEQLTIEDIRFRIQQLLTMEEVDQVLINQLKAIENDLDNISINEARDRIVRYKQSYHQVLNRKIEYYNLLLLEYAMFIPNENLIQQLNLERIPLINTYLSQFVRERFDL